MVAFASRNEVFIFIIFILFYCKFLGGGVLAGDLSVKVFFGGYTLC